MPTVGTGTAVAKSGDLYAVTIFDIISFGMFGLEKHTEDCEMLVICSRHEDMMSQIGRPVSQILCCRVQQCCIGVIWTGTACNQSTSQLGTRLQGATDWLVGVAPYVSSG